MVDMVVAEMIVGEGLCIPILAMMVDSSRLGEVGNVGEVGSLKTLGDIGPRVVESPLKEGSRMGDTRWMGVSKLSLGGTNAALGFDGVSRLARTVEGGGRAMASGGSSVNTRRWWSGVSGRLLVLRVRDRWRTLEFVEGALVSFLTSSRRFEADSERLDYRIPSSLATKPETDEFVMKRRGLPWANIRSPPNSQKCVRARLNDPIYVPRGRA
jgi:hypothetical protein